MASQKFNKKHQQLLQTAKELFWKHGFKRVTIEEICQKANVSKMTFYRHFDNKLAIAKAVFDMVAGDAVVAFKELMRRDISPSEKIQGMINMKLEGTHEISKEFLEDFYGNPELGVSGYIESKTLEMWTGIMDEFREAQRQGWIRKGFKPELMLLMTKKLIELAGDQDAQKLYGSPQELVMEIVNMITYGISPQMGR